MVARQIRIGRSRSVGPNQPALVVAELGQNHNGCPALAEALIAAAAWAGADAVKLVKRDLASELSREARVRPYDSRHAYAATYGEHRRALELSADDHAALGAGARRLGLLHLATACDAPSAAMLDEIGVDAFKIASRDLANLPLVRDVARRGRPVLLSTGMSGFDEVDAAVGELRDAGAEFVLLQCTSLYPTPFEHAHLRSLATLAARYDAPAGFSDHTPGVLLPPVAVALGAVVIEKHLTLDRNMKGTDHACSVEPDELRQLVADVRRVEAALGRSDKPLAPGTEAVRAKLGRSLVTRVALPAGTQIEEPMLALKCPGDGLSWFDRAGVLGRRLKRDLGADEKITWDDIT
ncbi:MAG TPA: N-acetylneuraminate synthase family protein [Pirellulales bacterium]|nr:N-acetylneuraminate synthase family protein [Pirellulales bacterium]